MLSVRRAFFTRASKISLIKSSATFPFETLVGVQAEVAHLFSPLSSVRDDRVEPRNIHTVGSCSPSPSFRSFSSSAVKEKEVELDDSLSAEELQEMKTEADELLLDTFAPTKLVNAEQGKQKNTEAVVRDLRGATVGSAQLMGEIWDIPIRKDIVHSVVVWQLAKRRKGNNKAKSRGEIQATGRKPHPQKGTGRARQGDRKGPHFRGGGRAHPPRPREFGFKLNKKVIRLGLKCALSARKAEGSLLLLDSLQMEEAKTKTANLTLRLLLGHDYPNTLFVDKDPLDQDFLVFKSATNNLFRVSCLPHDALNVYSILKARKLVMTVAALESMQARLSTPIKR